jgi:hypothetical protein
MAIGSSTIIPILTVGPTGPTGATGPTGTSGYDGITVGARGPTGATGLHIISGDNTSGRNLTITLSGKTTVSSKVSASQTDSKGNTQIVIPNFIGPTGSIGSADGTTGAGVVGLLKEVSAKGLEISAEGAFEEQIFRFKGLSGTNGITLSGGTTDDAPDVDLVWITGNKTYKEANIPGITTGANRLLYLSGGSTVGYSGLTFDGSKGIDFDNTITVDIEENIITIPEINKDNVVGITGAPCDGTCPGGTAGDGTGIQLEVRHGSVIKVQTPTGIAGFTGEFYNDEIFGFTLILDGNYLWDWPTNVYFDSDNSFFSCGEDIINFISNDGGVRWNATVASVGYGTDGSNCKSIVPIGSCCYVDDYNKRQCIEYTTEEICDNKNEGVWSSLSSCADNCGFTADGVCCSHGGNWGNYAGTGVCIEGNGLAECNYFGGTFLDFYYYEESLTPDNNNFYMSKLETPIAIECGGRFPCLNPNDDSCIEGEGILSETNFSNNICPNPCDTISCCKNGVCIGDSVGSDGKIITSASSCRYVYGGTPVEGLCGEIDCCNYSVVTGACCLDDVQQCVDTTNSACNNLNGIFMGPGSNCESDACCYDVPLGLCCLDGSVCNCCDTITGEKTNCCQNRTEQNCAMIGGSWQVGTCPDVTHSSCSCGVSSSCEIPLGACCVGYSNGICNDNKSKHSCDQLGGVWYQGKLCGNLPITCGGGQPCNAGEGGCADGYCCYPLDYDGNYTCQLCTDGGCENPTGDGCCPGDPPPCTGEECTGDGGCPDIIVDGPGGTQIVTRQCCCNGWCEPCPCSSSCRGCCCHLAGTPFAECECGGFEEGCSSYNHLGSDVWLGCSEDGAFCTPVGCEVVPDTLCCCNKCKTYYPQIATFDIEGCTTTCSGGTLGPGVELCGCGCNDCSEFCNCEGASEECCPPACHEGGGGPDGDWSWCPSSNPDDADNVGICCKNEGSSCCGDKCCSEEEQCCREPGQPPWYLEDGEAKCCGPDQICCTGVLGPDGSFKPPYCCDSEKPMCCGGNCHDPEATFCCSNCNNDGMHSCPANGMYPGQNTCCFNGCKNTCSEPHDDWNGLEKCCRSGEGNICRSCFYMEHCGFQCCCKHNQVDCGWGDGQMCCSPCCSDTDTPCPPGPCGYTGTGFAPPDGDDPLRFNPPDDYGWYDIHGDCLFMYCPEPCGWDSCDNPNAVDAPIFELKKGWHWYKDRGMCVYKEMSKASGYELCDGMYD